MQPVQEFERARFGNINPGAVDGENTLIPDSRGHAHEGGFSNPHDFAAQGIEKCWGYFLPRSAECARGRSVLPAQLGAKGREKRYQYGLISAAELRAGKGEQDEHRDGWRHNALASRKAFRLCGENGRAKSGQKMVAGGCPHARGALKGRRRGATAHVNKFFSNHDLHRFLSAMPLD